MNQHDATKLRHAWLAQLQAEYGAICRLYKVDLRKPLMEITDSQSYWGNWNARSRTLGISANLILNYPWEIVLAVLKHEMAHQIVTDFFRTDDKHGKLFLQACEIIGVPEEFISAGGDIPRKPKNVGEDGVTAETGAILEKVRKLLALAQSSNEHEASLAMQKANEFIEKHNLDRLERERKSRYVHKTIDLRRMRIENYHKDVCSILTDFFYTDIVLSSQYDALDNRVYRTIDLMGTAENVLIAEYVYHFLMDRLEHLWEDYRRKTGKPGRSKRSYWLGILKGFRENLERQEKSRHPAKQFDQGAALSKSSLVLAQDHGLSLFKRQRYPRLHYTREAIIYLETGAFQAGIKDGNELTLNRGVTGQDGNMGKLLTKD